MAGSRLGASLARCVDGDGLATLPAVSFTEHSSEGTTVHVRRRGAWLALLLTAWLAFPVAAQEASAVAQPRRGRGIEAIVAAALDEGLAAGLTTPEAISEAAREYREADRERLAAIDPGLPAALDELEAESEATLAAYIDEVLAGLEPEASPAPSVEPSPEASLAPEGRAGRAFLAAAVPRVPEPDRVFDQGGSYLSAVGQVTGMVEAFVGTPSPTRARRAIRPPRSSGVGPVSRSAAHANATRSRSASRSRRRIGPEPHARPATHHGHRRRRGHVIVDVCPDKDGTVVATATTSATVDAAGNGLSYRVVADADDRALATVDDEANVSSVAHSGSMSRHATGDRAVFASGGEGDAESHLAGTAEWTSDGSGHATSPTSVDVETAQGGNEADVRAWVLTRALAGALTDSAIKAAARVWRGGRCLELKADPPGKTVEPGSDTDIEVTIHQKAYDDEVERDVTATLDGTEEISPARPRPCPGDVHLHGDIRARGRGHDHVEVGLEPRHRQGAIRDLSRRVAATARHRRDRHLQAGRGHGQGDVEGAGPRGSHRHRRSARDRPV